VTDKVLVDIVIHIASCMDARFASHLIKALGQRRKINGKEAYFIHVSFFYISLPDNLLNLNQSTISTTFADDGGWPHGEVRDSDPIFEREKALNDAGFHPTRAVCQVIAACRIIASSVYGF